MVEERYSPFQLIPDRNKWESERAHQLAVANGPPRALQCTAVSQPNSLHSAPLSYKHHEYTAHHTTSSIHARALAASFRTVFRDV